MYCPASARGPASPGVFENDYRDIEPVGDRFPRTRRQVRMNAKELACEIQVAPHGAVMRRGIGRAVALPSQPVPSPPRRRCLRSLEQGLPPRGCAGAGIAKRPLAIGPRRCNGDAAVWHVAGRVDGEGRWTMGGADCNYERKARTRGAVSEVMDPNTTRGARLGPRAVHWKSTLKISVRVRQVGSLNEDSLIAGLGVVHFHLLGACASVPLKTREAHAVLVEPVATTTGSAFFGDWRAPNRYHTWAGSRRNLTAGPSGTTLFASSSFPPRKASLRGRLLAGVSPPNVVTLPAYLAHPVWNENTEAGSLGLRRNKSAILLLQLDVQPLDGRERDAVDIDGV